MSNGSRLLRRSTGHRQPKLLLIIRAKSNQSPIQASILSNPHAAQALASDCLSADNTQDTQDEVKAALKRLKRDEGVSCQSTPVDHETNLASFLMNSTFHWKHLQGLMPRVWQIFCWPFCCLRMILLCHPILPLVSTSSSILFHNIVLYEGSLPT